MLLKRLPRPGFLLVLALGGPASACAGEKALTDTSRSPHARVYAPDLGQVTWNGGLLGERFETCRTVMVPYLWRLFQDDNESHAWSNFLIAAGLGRGRDGKFHGPPFNDGDFLKWLEALAQVYAVTRDPALDRQMDEIIAVLAKAQRADGYLHTQKIIPQRQGAANAQEFSDREHFETYNMGHLMTAGCVHHRATGKTSLLALARKAADYLEHLAETVPDDLARNAICPSHYMGVVELYRVTREPRYQALAQRLVDLRDRVPPEFGSDQNQDRLPFRQMTEAVGHAVRANYLFAGVADLVAENGDPTLLRTLTTLADDVITQKLYITGMTGALYDGASPDGASRHGTIKPVHQAYGRDYQLPNLTAYNETCATIGFALWMARMFTVTGEARYMDRFEQSLYNGVLPGVSLEGKHYFYVNALKRLNDFPVPLRWSRTRTPNLKSSFCCPPNVVRTIAEAHNYVYALSADTLWVNLYAASTLDTAWVEGGRIRLRQTTEYPWDGRVSLAIEAAPERAVALRLRVPGWLRPGQATLELNGRREGLPLVPGTYAEIRRTWRAGDEVRLAFDFTPALWEANPWVEETLGQVAVRSGPIVYCLESVDLPAGVKLTDVALAAGADPKSFAVASTRLGGVPLARITLPGTVRTARAWTAGELYREAGRPESRAVTLQLTPYFAWGNRGEADMSVWLPQR
jgi:DUF1680 family protein